MGRREVWESIKKNKWTIWKYFRAICWMGIFAISVVFILLLVVTLFI